MAAHAAEATPTLNAPPISGDLYPLAKTPDVTALKTQDAAVSLITDAAGPALKVDYALSTIWPNVKFPCPEGGWDLSDFAGVQASVQNTGPAAVFVSLRVDNAGPWQEAPWNTGSISIPAGATKTLATIFGQPGVYPLDTARIVGIQIHLTKPATANTLLIRDLKAFGSAKDRPAGLFSTPLDRDKLVTPPAWTGTRPPVEGDWVRTFNEDFDGPKINEKLWNTRTWWNGYIPNEVERYSAENLVFENGAVRFKTEKRTGFMFDDPTLVKRDYTAAYLNTFDKWTQTYGYFEARIKLPTTRGLWPAFWMMPDRGRGEDNIRKRGPTDNNGMEIDIMEQLAEWGPGRYNVAAHWDNYGADHKRWGTSFNYFGKTPDDFHTFGALWEPGKITWFCDGKKAAEWANPRVGTTPMHFILNMQMGGWATKDIDDAKLPDAMVVDYVRAWQLKNRLLPGQVLNANPASLGTAPAPGAAPAQVSPVSTPVTATPGANLLKNGDFETESPAAPPSGWLIWGAAKDRNPQDATRDTTQAHSGKASYRLHHPENTGAFTITDRTDNLITTKHGATYDFSFWAKTDQPGLSQIAVNAFTSLNPFVMAPQVLSRQIPVTADWKQFTFSVSEGPNFSADSAHYLALSINPSLFIPATPEKTLWIDDVVVTERMAAGAVQTPATPPAAVAPIGVPPSRPAVAPRPAATGPEAPADLARVARWKDDKKSAFMLMFDDSLPSDLTTVIPELQKRNMVGTFYINPGQNHYKKNADKWEKEVPAIPGMALANHTMVHLGFTDGPTASADLAAVNTIITKANPGKTPRLISFGRPGMSKDKWTVPEPDFQKALWDNYLIERPNFWQHGSMYDPVKTTADMLKIIDKGLADGSAEYLIFHGVGGDWIITPTEMFTAFLDGLAAKRDQIWITDHISAHKYETERKTARIGLLESNAKLLRLELTSNTDPALYDLPLTLVVQVSPTWKQCLVTQGATVTKATPTAGHLQFEALPNAGPIVVMPA